VALRVKMVVDCAVNSDEFLQGAHPSKATDTRTIDQAVGDKAEPNI